MAEGSDKPALASEACDLEHTQLGHHRSRPESLGWGQSRQSGNMMIQIDVLNPSA